MSLAPVASSVKEPCLAGGGSILNLRLRSEPQIKAAMGHVPQNTRLKQAGNLENIRVSRAFRFWRCVCFAVIRPLLLPFQPLSFSPRRLPAAAAQRREAPARLCHSTLVEARR